MVLPQVSMGKWVGRELFRMPGCARFQSPMPARTEASHGS